MGLGFPEPQQAAMILGAVTSTHEPYFMCQNMSGCTELTVGLGFPEPQHAAMILGAVT